MPRPRLPQLFAGLVAGLVAAAAPADPPLVIPRAAPLPAEMQGRWADADDPATELVVTAGEVAYAGRPVAYDHKRVIRQDGALTVSLEVADPAREDTFQRENITGLLLTPEGELHAYNVKFISRFVRKADR